MESTAAKETSTPKRTAADIMQLYQTMLKDREGGYVFHVLVIPQRSLSAYRRDTATAARACRFLGLELLNEVPLPMYLPHLLIALSRSSSIDGIREAYFALVNNPSAALTNVDRALIAFAQDVAFSELIPFEMSEPKRHSLASIALQARIVTGGTAIGLAAVNGHALALVTVPLGIVLLGGAFSLTEAFPPIITMLMRRLGLPGSPGEVPPDFTDAPARNSARMPRVDETPTEANTVLSKDQLGRILDEAIGENPDVYAAVRDRKDERAMRLLFDEVLERAEGRVDLDVLADLLVERLT